MARSYGQIHSAVWIDQDFQKLSGSAQRAYLMLITQADITSAGVLSLTVGRWSRYSRDTPSDALWDALSELQETAFIAYDEDTEELLVRKFVKWDGGATNAKRRPAITAAANVVVSPGLRAMLATELDEMSVPHGISDALSNKASDTPRVVVTEVGNEPQPLTSTLSPEPAPSAEARKRATRLPKDWTPSQELIDWQRSEGISDLVARRELPRFQDYWAGVGGDRGRKADWPATWRNWLRRSHADQPTRPDHENDPGAWAR